jgi:hypothetical protein
MKSHVPRHPHSRRSERGPVRGRVSIVMSMLVVLAVSLAVVAATRAVVRPAPGHPQVAAAAVAAPAQAPVATYTASITNGAGQNDLYDWLTGRAGTIVHLVLSISKPVAADMVHHPRSITLASNCSKPSPPANCARLLNLAGTRYLVYGDATNAVTLANGVYHVDAYVAVEPVTQDSKGMYTLPLRIVDLNGPASGEDD